MKIVLICNYYNDGMGYLENILPYYYKKLGHDVVVIVSDLTSGYLGKDRRVPAGDYENNGYIVKRIKTKWEFKNRFVVFENLAKYLEDEKPDYIYHVSSTTLSIKDIAKYKEKHPNTFVAADNHGDLNNSGKNTAWRFLYYNVIWKCILKKYRQNIDVFFGVSPNRCIFLEEELGIPKDKIRLLPIGCDEDNARIDISKEEFFAKYNLDSNNFIITNGGKITPEKDVDKIVEAFLRIKDQDVNLVLFGKLMDPKVEKLIMKDSRIKYIGWLDRRDTMAMLHYSDIGIWNKLHTTLLEDSVAAGLPLILRYYGNTAHLIKESGLFLYEGSVREIQDKIQFVLRNRHLVKEFKENVKKLRQVLSYNNTAKESLSYMEDMSPKTAHKTFMSEEFTDYSYKNLRFIK